VMAIVDSTRAGTDAAAAIGVGRGVPIVASVDEAARLGADIVLIGTAAPGGRIADADRPHLRRALEAGLTVWNGLMIAAFARTMSMQRGMHAVAT